MFSEMKKIKEPGISQEIIIHQASKTFLYKLQVFKRKKVRHNKQVIAACI